jgi:hypothetical protein
VLSWLRRSIGSSRSVGVLLSGLDDVFHPSGSRAREDLRAQHEMVVPVPSPGDTMLKDGHVVLDHPRSEELGTSESGDSAGAH